MRTLIFFFATLIASLLATHNPNKHDSKKIEERADTLYSNEKPTSCDILIKKNSLKNATIYSFYVL
jgi:hypothetical protein